MTASRALALIRVNEPSVYCRGGRRVLSVFAENSLSRRACCISNRRSDAQAACCRASRSSVPAGSCTALNSLCQIAVSAAAAWITGNMVPIPAVEDLPSAFAADSAMGDLGSLRQQCCLSLQRCRRCDSDECETCGHEPSFECLRVD